jgi:hypothetical protein
MPPNMPIVQGPDRSGPYAMRLAAIADAALMQQAQRAMP